jgi:hypothetical protein
MPGSGGVIEIESEIVMESEIVIVIVIVGRGAGGVGVEGGFVSGWSCISGFRDFAAALEIAVAMRLLGPASVAPALERAARLSAMLTGLIGRFR